MTPSRAARRSRWRAKSVRCDKTILVGNRHILAPAARARDDPGGVLMRVVWVVAERRHSAVVARARMRAYAVAGSGPFVRVCADRVNLGSHRVAVGAGKDGRSCRIEDVCTVASLCAIQHYHSFSVIRPEGSCQLLDSLRGGLPTMGGGELYGCAGGLDAECPVLAAQRKCIYPVGCILSVTTACRSAKIANNPHELRRGSPRSASPAVSVPPLALFARLHLRH